jgi:hypothetical protein
MISQCSMCTLHFVLSMCEDIYFVMLCVNCSADTTAVLWICDVWLICTILYMTWCVHTTNSMHYGIRC